MKKLRWLTENEIKELIGKAPYKINAVCRNCIYARVADIKGWPDAVHCLMDGGDRDDNHSPCSYFSYDYDRDSHFPPNNYNLGA